MDKSLIDKLPKTLIAVVGPSGTGKSSLFASANQTLMRVIDVERKGMPFKVTDPGFLKQVSDWDTYQKARREAIADPSRPILGIDSFTAVADFIQTYCEKTYKGFEIWKVYNDLIGDELRTLKNSGKTVFITSLEEIVVIQGLDGNTSTRRRAFIQGKEWANKGIESECLAVWSSFGKIDKDTKKATYHVATQTDGITLAKTPPFWKVPDVHTNDLGKILEIIARNA